MASLSAQYPSPCGTSLAMTSMVTISSLPKYSQYPFIHKTSQPISRPRNRNPNYKPVTSQARRNDEQSPLRRDVLIGLGGLYTAASNDPFALASPILGPDLNQCQNTIKGINGAILDERCCLIRTSEPKPFVLPRNPKVVARQAAHLADDEYYKIYEDAIRIMRSLPDDDPRSFMNQAKIHCAYCNDAYVEANGTTPFQVHQSALFFPFHRWYLYFFERICGNIIGNPDFRLPFWNWDVPEGMEMPERYTRNQNSPLYDAFRNADHVPTGKSPIANLQLPKVMKGDNQRSLNLGTMNNAMVRNSKTPESFFGRIYGAGLTSPESGSGGQIESGPHTSLHIWIGDPTQEYGADMGSFHTSGKDPIFYAHHANVDRMWNIWKSGVIPGYGCRKDFTNRDWLDTEFVLYDENGKMVTVTVEGCLDSAKLGYEYEEVSIKPWLDCRITSKPPNVDSICSRIKASFTPKPLPIPINILEVTFPIKLDKVVEVTVNRPGNYRKRSSEEKAKRDEVLVVQNICGGEEEYYVKFDVFVNDDDYETTTPLNSEFAGSFAVLEPGGHMMKMKNMKMRGADLSLSLTEILEDLKAENDESIKVTLVPRIGCGKVTVGGIKIDSRDIF